ncbi:MAG: beta-ketoacyl synthase N-terminal-like domain-containing protein, partial [Spirochaetales bacterium]|nr:beta-ketoacyl synthase N-terminal-like domain-containing protein [Spirochaetales bacterium]
MSKIDNYDIAVIGMGCVFPEANNTDEYWANILSGDEYVKDMPEHLWPMKSFWSKERINHKSVTTKGCFLKDFDFNPIEYGIPPKNLEGVDRAQLVAMEAVKQALADAGIKPKSPELEQGVTVIGASGVDEFAHVTLYLNRLKFFAKFEPYLDAAGLSSSEKEQLFEEFSETLRKRGHNFYPSITSIGAVASSLSNRIAQVFGVKGFNMSVDGACASSFVALNTACHALMAGDARIAIAGGIDLGINPPIYIGFSRLGGLSPDGKSNPFDNNANGLVIGEGGGVVVLKRLEDAVADGDNIKAVIRGIGTTSDGAGQAIYNPSSEQRAIALEKALKCAEIKASDIQFLEAHATSTVVGDANEYDAINAAYGDREVSNPLYLGTVKHQIGHLKAGSGVAGLIKTILAMNAGKIPHMPRFRELTKLASEKNDAFIINNEVLDWAPRENGSRYAAVTTSGFGGVNYHAILEQAPSYTVRERVTPDRDMAIVGIVNRYPGAIKPETFWDNLLAGKDNFEDIDAEKLGWQENISKGPVNERIGTRKIALLDDFDINYLRLKVTPNSISQTSPAQILSVEMSDRLLADYGMDIKEHKNIGVSIGSMHDDNFSTIFYPLSADEYGEAIRLTETFSKYADKITDPLQKTIDAVLADGPPLTEATLPGWMSNVNAGIVANRLNCNGPNFTVDTACSSGLAAFLPAMYQLMFSDIDAMITGGLNRHTTNAFETSVDRLGAIAVDVAKPFDKDGSGFLSGEGGALFLVKRLKDARAANDKVFGIISNVAGSSEYKTRSMVAPTEDAIYHAIAEGMRHTKIKPEEIGVVDTHGSANRLSDICEAGAIARALRPEGGTPPVHITAVKSHVGHSFGGSGAASVLSVIGTLTGRQVPGIRNLENYRPEIEGILDKACPQKKTAPLEKTFTAGGVTSLGLGGANYFAVISAGDEGLENAEKGISFNVPEAAPASASVSQPVNSSSSSSYDTIEGIFKITGQSLGDIRKACQLWIDSGKIVKNDSDPLILTASYDSPATLKNKLSTVIKFIDNNANLAPLENQGIYLIDNRKASSEKLTFCFPGQGTHYVGMGRFLYETLPEFREVIDKVHNLAKADIGFDLLADLYGSNDPKEAAAHLGGLDGAQISLFAVEVGLARVYASMGVVPDSMVGHSFGEISALAAQGVWSLEDAYKVVSARIKAAKEGGRGLDLKMMSIACSDTQRDALLSLGGGEVVLSNINAPGQFIFAGKKDVIMKLSETAETLGLEARILAIGSAFHSRFMEDAVEPFRKAIEVLPCRQPSIPIMSTITKDYISFKDSEELAKHLSLQLTTQLDMPTVINKLYDDGSRNFLEVGPKWAVTNYIKVILKDRDFKAVPSIHPKIGDEETFRRSMAYLTGLGRIGTGVSGMRAGVAFTIDSDFMSYLRENEPAVISLLSESHRRFKKSSGKSSFGNTAPVLSQPAVSSVSSIKATESPAVTSSAIKDASAPVVKTAAKPSVTAVDKATWIVRAKNVLAESTGYPEDMLGEELDLEADLGIDSVQRAEIWGKLVADFGLDPEARPSSIKTIT